MASTVIAPVTLVCTTALADVTNSSSIAAGKVRSYDVRAANVHASSDATVDLVITNGTTTINRVKNYPVPFGVGSSAPDLEMRLLLPAGWYIRAKASLASAVEVSVTGVEDAA